MFKKKQYSVSNFRLPFKELKEKAKLISIPCTRENYVNVSKKNPSEFFEIGCV